jgi:hypothetical protein
MQRTSSRVLTLLAPWFLVSGTERWLEEHGNFARAKMHLEASELFSGADSAFWGASWLAGAVIGR